MKKNYNKVKKLKKWVTPKLTIKTNLVLAQTSSQCTATDTSCIIVSGN